MNWSVVTIKYGRKLQQAFAKPGGEALRHWIDDCPNSLYSALTFQGGAAWRQAVLADLGRSRSLRALIDPLSDDDLAALMTNLGGHDIETLIDIFRQAEAAGDHPTCFIAYTIKGMGLPFAGHKDNHAGMMTKDQMEIFRAALNIRPGHEWDRFEGLDIPEQDLEAFLNDCPFATPLTPQGRYLSAPTVHIPATLPAPKTAGRKLSTQSGFGDILAEIGRGQGEYADLAAHILTTSPDVTVSTNLGPWVNRRGVFDRHTRNDVFRDAKLASAQRWGMSPKGQHIELGIAEQNLFLVLGAAGLTHALTGARLLPIGTGVRPVREPRPRCPDLRLLPGRPVPARLHPVGPDPGPRGRPAPIRQHPADRHGRRPARQLRTRPCGRTRHPHAPRFRSDAAARRVVRLAPPLHPPARPAQPHPRPGFRDRRRPLGHAPGPRRPHRHRLPGPRRPRGRSRLRRTPRRGPRRRPARHHQPRPAPCRLDRRRPRPARGRRSAASHIERILAPLAPGAALVTVLDGHPATHSWLGAVRGQRVIPLGPDHFGQSGDIPDLYREYRMDTDAILDACAQALLT